MKPPKKTKLEPIRTYKDIMYGQVVTVRVFEYQGEKKPKPFRPHSGSFTADDRKQEYALTGTKFPDAAPATYAIKHAIPGGTAEGALREGLRNRGAA